jgi:hypothetical protein
MTTIKKIILQIIFLFLAFNSFAQQNHYIYIQTENKQPFFVKQDKKVLSSSSTGYLIIPKLQDGDHTFSIGFPKNEWPQQNVTISIQKKDLGFLLKNFNEKGWGLFNMQTLQVTSLGSNTPSQPDVAKEQPKEQPKQIQEKIIEQPKATETKPIQTNSNSITKLSAINKPDGKELIYLDNNNGVIDTVKIFIKDEISKTEIISNPIIQPKTEEIKKDEILNNEPSRNKPALPVVENKPAPKIEAPKDNAQLSPIKSSPNGCKNFASDEDFIKLRAKMANSTSDDEMLYKAHIFFTKKCFTTKQIDLLSTLFLSDGGKYKFFDDAFQYVSDPQNFGQLQKNLTETYYIKRFKTLIDKE